MRASRAAHLMVPSYRAALVEPALVAGFSSGDRSRLAGLPRYRSSWGQVPVAAVVPRAGAAPAADELLAFARQELAAYKLPRRIRFVAELSRNAGGKLVRRALQEEVQDG